MFQSTRVKGTFYQDFKYGSLIPTTARSLAGSHLRCALRATPRSSARLKNYPYGSLDLGIGMRLYPFVNNEPGSATVLPVPLATRGGSANNGNSAGNGWYVSNLRLKANQPDFWGGIDDYTLTNPLANNAVSWRGAELDEELYREGTYRLGEFVSIMVGIELDRRVLASPDSLTLLLSDSLPLCLSDIRASLFARSPECLRADG